MFREEVNYTLKKKQSVYRLDFVIKRNTGKEGWYAKSKRKYFCFQYYYFIHVVISSYNWLYEKKKERVV